MQMCVCVCVCSGTKREKNNDWFQQKVKEMEKLEPGEKDISQTEKKGKENSDWFQQKVKEMVKSAFYKSCSIKLFHSFLADFYSLIFR